MFERETIMPVRQNDRNPVTTVWQNRQSETVLVQTFQGLPFGPLKFGDVVNVPGFGTARCTGGSNSGSGTNATILEIRLTLM